MWDKKYLVITLANLTVDCIHESEQFSGHIDIAIMAFFNLCTCDGFGHLDKKNPTLRSRTLELLAFSEKLLADSLYAYCLGLLVIGNLFCTLATYIISFVYSNWNYQKHIFLQEENLKQFNKRNKKSSCAILLIVFQLYYVCMRMCTEEI